MNKKPTIVLIDEEKYLKKFLTAKIFTTKFNIISAHTGKDGISLIFKHRPDLIVSGVLVSKGDIYYIMNVLKHNPEIKDIPVVAFSYLCSIEDEKEVKQAGACDYIKKHECTPEKLTKSILKILKKKK